jgi:phospho-N-acetylmuramoyl-pentapeptide-transferase
MATGRHGRKLHMSAIGMALLGLLSFMAGVAWCPWYIRLLIGKRIGKSIRAVGPESHSGKAGTPTMGGWVITLTASVVAVVFLRDWPMVAPVIAAMLVFGIMGAIDDLAGLGSQEGLGLQVRYKFLWHNAVALGTAYAIYSWSGRHSLDVPGWGSLELGWWYVPLGMLVIFSCTSGVNEVDGLDGLAAGLSAIAFAAYGVLTWRSGQADLAALCAILVGACLAFLWFNSHPAKVFMGDTGSLALGAALGAIALQSQWVLLLPVIGLVLVVDLGSVILQVAYFKVTHGKRIFRMSPIHHHFELSGWSEVQVVQRFWIVAVLVALLGIGLTTLGR